MPTTTFYEFKLLVIGDCLIDEQFTADHPDKIYQYCLDQKYDIDEAGKKLLCLYDDKEFVQIGKVGEMRVYYCVQSVKVIIRDERKSEMSDEVQVKSVEDRLSDVERKLKEVLEDHEGRHRDDLKKELAALAKKVNVLEVQTGGNPLA